MMSISSTIQPKPSCRWGMPTILRLSPYLGRYISILFTYWISRSYYFMYQ